LSPLVALGAGLLSFLSPCVLPLVPVYLASLYGPEIFDGSRRNRVPVFLHALSFVGGFFVVFVALGVAAGLVGFVLSPQAMTVRAVSGGLLVAFGAFMLLALKVPWLNYEARLAPSRRLGSGYLRSFLTGAVFTLAWTPCIGPVLGSVMTLALDSATALQGGYLLGFYSVGLGLPFLAIGAAFDTLTPVLKRIGRYSVWVSIVSGILLIAMGVLVLTNRVTWLQGG